jgi:hypothetical protein
VNHSLYPDSSFYVKSHVCVLCVYHVYNYTEYCNYVCVDFVCKGKYNPSSYVARR